MRLIVVPAVERNPHPVARSLFSLEHIEDTLEPNNPAQRLGRQADSRIKSPVKFSQRASAGRNSSYRTKFVNDSGGLMFLSTLGAQEHGVQALACYAGKEQTKA